MIFASAIQTLQLSHSSYSVCSVVIRGAKGLDDLLETLPDETNYVYRCILAEVMTYPKSNGCYSTLLTTILSIKPEDQPFCKYMYSRFTDFPLTSEILHLNALNDPKLNSNTQT